MMILEEYAETYQQRERPAGCKGVLGRTAEGRRRNPFVGLRYGVNEGRCCA